MNASAISKFASIFLLCSVIACHEPSVPPPPPPHPAAVESARQPVTQVVQTFNLPYDQAWPAVVSAIKEQKLEIKIADMNSGKILTEWVDVEDELCGVYPRTGAKLACRVRFIVEMDPLSFRASSFTASYYEE
ncbi:MAG TPA: hypothetical protein PLP17_00515, partial [Oligoflexia bacterium]|nr:hypothetical protein [Oligoflexia bacterium]